MALTYPPKRSLARLDTPLTKLERTSNELGVEFWIKRDDTTGLGLSGNKIRKLEYLMHEAIEQGCDTVITGGGKQSNHCRATAVAAAQLGLSSVLCLRVEDKSVEPPTQGNILLDRMVGAEIVWIDFEDWRRQSEVYDEQAERLRKLGKKPYIIPEGGSNALGSWGYIECARELSEAIGNLDPKPTTVVYACGSGGTGAGLVLGAKAYDFAERGISVAGINVCDDEAYFVDKIHGICTSFEERFGTGLSVEREDIRIVDGHKGLGYAKSRPEELECIRDMSRREGIFLDPVYTGKAFYGLCQELAADRSRFGERIVYLHTGGAFGLFAAAEMLDPILRS